jgi:proline iminopeptidase
MRIRDVDLNVKVIGHGYPLGLMHGGPSGDLDTMLSFRQLRDQFTLVFYDHRCNGRSTGVPVTSMTWENLTADADALCERLGFEKWAVLGHSFGGNVALEYALRYPDRLSHLVLLNTGAEGRWSLENASTVLAQRGYSPDIVNLAKSWLNGEVPPEESFRTLMKLGKAYNPHSGIGLLGRMALEGAWRSKLRPEALIFAAHHLLPGWSVMDRLGEIRVPTLVMAGKDDFIFPPEHQAELAARIPNARLKLIERAGHNPHDEQTAEVMKELRAFIRPEAGARAA